MTPDIFSKRRNLLINELQHNELIMIYANDPVGGSGTGANKFLQNSHFYYLTGLDLPSAILVLGNLNDQTIDMIFIERNIPERIIWDGEKMHPEQVTELTGIKNIQFLDNYEATIASYLSQADKVYLNIGNPEMGKPLNKAQVFVKVIRDRVPHVQFKNVDERIKPFRQIKDASEIEAITEAIKVTFEGIKGIWEIVIPGMMEYELEARLHYEMERRACCYGFLPIIGAGKNAATLHYVANNCRVAENDLLLTDVGAYFKHYSADITRTIPVNGKFNQRQKEVYTEVLAIQKDVISMMKPGVAMNDVLKRTKELMFESLKKLGLITEEHEVSKYFMHGIGHHLGLDVHDIGERDFILQEGMVTTIEPGIYIPEEGIGVRIEDDILITENGHKILSEFIPKEINELEDYIQKLRS